MANKTITVKLVKSVITHPENIRATVRGLGLKRLGMEKTLENTPAVRGMIKKVINLLEIKEN